MISFKNEKGIAIVSLAIIIVVLFIISGVAIYTGTTGTKEVNDSKLNSELQMVQHAVLEQYVKYKTTRNEMYLVGNKLEKEQVDNIANELGIQLVNIPDTYSNRDYYQLNKDSLKAIGIDNTDDEYIINYISGEVINITQKKLSNQTPLYTKANSF